MKRKHNGMLGDLSPFPDNDLFGEPYVNQSTCFIFKAGTVSFLSQDCYQTLCKNETTPVCWVTYMVFIN